MTPPKLVGRVQAVTQFVAYATLPLYPVLAGLARDAIGGPAAIELFLALTAVVALIATLSHSVRSIPRPASWPPAS